jgi:hypothetical protein
MKLGFTKSTMAQEKHQAFHLEIDDMVGVLKQGIGRALEHLHMASQTNATIPLSAAWVAAKLQRMAILANQMHEAQVKFSAEQGADQPKN